MTTVNISAITNTVTVTENGSSTVVTVPQTSTVTAITEGPQGSAGAGYIHTQASPSATWTITHNLGFKPSVELLNTGSQEIDGDVVHTSYNVTVVYFTAAIAGFARLT
jgi:uncharacterized protein YjdB